MSNSALSNSALSNSASDTGEGVSSGQVQPTITVRGSGAAHATPDRVVLRAEIWAEAPQVSDALKTAERRAAEAISALARLGVTGADVRTDSVTVQPTWDRDGQVTGQRCGHQLAVRVADVAALPGILDALAAAADNGLSVSEVSLVVSNPEVLLAQAMDAAVDDARAKAELLAQRTGLTLGRALRVWEPVTQSEPRGYGMDKMVMASGTAIAPGETTVTSSITIEFAAR